MQKMPTSPKICASTTLGNLKWQIEPSTQYLHVYINESLNSYETTGSFVSKNVKRAVNHIVFTSYARNVCLQHDASTYRYWRHVANRTFNEQRDSDRSLVCDI